MKAKLSTKNPDDYFVFWRDDSGRLIKKRLGINRIKSLKERKIFGKELCTEINRTLKYGPSRPSCIKELRGIIDSKKNSLRHRSWQSYHYAVNMLEKWLDGTEPTMEQITRPMMKQFVESLFDKGYNGHTINGIRGFLGTVFATYEDRNEGYVNPFKGTRKARLESGRHFSFTDQQVQIIREKLSPELLLFTRFIYFTYIRPIELLRLRAEDIRIDMGEIIIKGDQNKNKKQQSVVIPDSFLNEIKQMGYEKMPGSHFIFGKGLLPGSTPYSRNSVTKQHRKVLTELEFSNDYTLYSWKHTGVVAAYKAGIDIYSIMRQLRHHSLEMTQIYLKSLGLVRNEQFGKLMV